MNNNRHNNNSTPPANKNNTNLSRIKSFLTPKKSTPPKKGNSADFRRTFNRTDSKNVEPFPKEQGIEDFKASPKESNQPKGTIKHDLSKNPDFSAKSSDFSPKSSDFSPKSSDFSPKSSDFNPKGSDFSPRGVSPRNPPTRSTSPHLGNSSQASSRPDSPVMFDFTQDKWKQPKSTPNSSADLKTSSKSKQKHTPKPQEKVTTKWVPKQAQDEWKQNVDSFLPNSKQSIVNFLPDPKEDNPSDQGHSDFSKPVTLSREIPQSLSEDSAKDLSHQQTQDLVNNRENEPAAVPSKLEAIPSKDSKHIENLKNFKVCESSSGTSMEKTPQNLEQFSLQSPSSPAPHFKIHSKKQSHDLEVQKPSNKEHGLVQEIIKIGSDHKRDFLTSDEEFDELFFPNSQRQYQRSSYQLQTPPNDRRPEKRGSLPTNQTNPPPPSHFGHSRNSSISSYSSTGTRSSISRTRNRSTSGTDVKLWKLQRRKMELHEDKLQTEHSLTLLKQGYNDLNIGAPQLQERLNEIKKQIESIEKEENEILNAASRRSGSGIPIIQPPSPRSAKHMKTVAQELKKKLLPLDYRVEFYTVNEQSKYEAKLKRKSKLWFLDDFEFETNSDNNPHKKRKDFNESLKMKDIEIDIRELKLGVEIYSNHSTVYKGVWNSAPHSINPSVSIQKLDSFNVNNNNNNNNNNNTNISDNKHKNTFRNFVDDLKKLRINSHENIIKYYGISKMDNDIYLISEYLEGYKSLHEIMHKQQIQFDVLLVMKLAREISEGMLHLHSAKIVHNDLRSENILVNPQNGVKIIGFLEGQKIGDSKYRAPELVRGEKAFTEKIDIYSYGLLVWEILTGKVPFEDLQPVTAQAKAAYENLRPVIPQTCSPLLRKMIRYSWHPDPDQRPSFNEIIEFFKHVEGQLFFSSRGGFWTLDKASEMERENQRRKKYQELLNLLDYGKQEILYSDLVLGSKIGTGSFAKVYIGTWKSHTVAIKVLKNGNITEKFFLREVQNLRNCYHPNVVVFFGASIDPPAIITEYMSGGSLYDALHEKKVILSLELVLKMARDVAEGMKHLHSLEILHRDLTSKNILLDDYQNLKISDFGLSRSMETEMSLAGICAPRWRPPEITRGHPYDEKVDVYSYALVLYEMITSKLPFEELDGVNAAAQAAYCSKRPDLPASTPEPLQNLIKSAWCDDPKQRPNFASISSSIVKIHEVLKSPEEDEELSEGEMSDYQNSYDERE